MCGNRLSWNRHRCPGQRFSLGQSNHEWLFRTADECSPIGLGFLFGSCGLVCEYFHTVQDLPVFMDLHYRDPAGGRERVAVSGRPALRNLVQGGIPENPLFLSEVSLASGAALLLLQPRLFCCSR